MLRILLWRRPGGCRLDRRSGLSQTRPLWREGSPHCELRPEFIYTETLRFLYQLSISPPPPARPDHGQRTELQHHQRQSPHYIRIGLAWLNKGHTMSVSMMSFTGVPHCEWEVRNNADSIILSISNSFNVSSNPYLILIIGSDRTPKKSKWHKFVNLPPKNPDWLHRYHRRCCPRQISVSDFVIPDVEIESDLETYQTCYP